MPAIPTRPIRLIRAITTQPSAYARPSERKITSVQISLRLSAGSPSPPRRLANEYASMSQWPEMEYHSLRRSQAAVAASAPATSATSPADGRRAPGERCSGSHCPLDTDGPHCHVRAARWPAIPAAQPYTACGFPERSGPSRAPRLHGNGRLAQSVRFGRRFIRLAVAWLTSPEKELAMSEKSSASDHPIDWRSPDDVKSLGRDLFDEFKQDDVPTLASAVAFHTVFAIPAILILIVLAAALVNRATNVDVTGNIRELIQDNAPG